MFENLIAITNGVDLTRNQLIFTWSIMIMITQSYYTITFFDRPHRPGFKFHSMFTVITASQLLALWLVAHNNDIRKTDLAGLSLSIVGMILFFKTLSSTKTNQLNVAFSREHSTKLIKTGTFAFVRHPFYTSYLTLWSSLSLFSHSLLGVLPFLAVLPFYYSAAKEEETALLSGPCADEYRIYMTQTGMFLPKVNTILAFAKHFMDKFTYLPVRSLTILQVFSRKHNSLQEREMTQKIKLNIWTAKLADKNMEKTFMQSAINESSTFGAITMIIATVLFASYAFIDIKTLDHGHLIASIRLLVSAIGFSAVILALRTRNQKFLADISLVGMTFYGLLICFAIHLESDPFNEYYKGILQITIIGSIVLRMEFLKWTISLFIIFATFWLSTKGVLEGQRYTNILLFLATTSIACALGVYNIELSRRRAFLMRVDIQQKSDKLAIMNAREVKSAKSKNAMINILAHFYNTPVHQIKGFSELLQSGGKALDQDTSSAYLDQIIDSTVSLNRFTQKVLEYNTLPEVPKVVEFSTVSISSLLKPAINDAKALTECEIDIEDFKITGPADQLTLIMTSLVENISEHAGDISLISITARLENGMARIEINDNGSGLTAAQFAESVLPFQELTKFMAMGEKVPMGLRYAEKVLHMLGGEIQAIEGMDGTKLLLTFPAIYDAQNSPWLDQKRATG